MADSTTWKVYSAMNKKMIAAQRDSGADEDHEDALDDVSGNHNLKIVWQSAYHLPLGWTRPVLAVL